jgi:hypothetical protein
MTIRWYPEMDVAVIKYKDLPYEEAADVIGVCKSALIKRQQQLGVFTKRGRGTHMRQRRKVTATVEQKLRDIWGDPDKKVSELSRREGLPPSTLISAAQRLNLGPKAKHDNTQRTLAFIRSNPGCRSQDIRHYLRIEPTNVYVILRKLLVENLITRLGTTGRFGGACFYLTECTDNDNA